MKESDRLQPFRRDVRYFDAREAPVRPLLPVLSLAQGSVSWGQVMRRGTFRVDEADYKIIAEAMHVADYPEGR